MSCNGPCCDFTNYHAYISGIGRIDYFSSAAAMFLLCSFSYVLVKLHKAHANTAISLYSPIHDAFSGAPSPRGRQFALPIYYTYTHLAALIFVLEVLLLLILPQGTFATSVSIILFSIQCGFLDNAAFIFLCFPRSDMKSVRKTVKIAGVMTIVYLVVLGGLFASDSKFECGYCSVFLPTKQVLWVYCGCSMFYIGVGIAYLKKVSWFNPRPMAKYWALFLLVAYVGALICLVQVEFFKIDAGYCIFTLLVVWYAGGFAPLIYYVMQRDSEYCYKYQLQLEEDPTVNAQLRLDLKNPLLSSGSSSSTDSSSNHVIKQSDLIIGERCGIGGYGEVFKAMWHGTPCAVKRLHSLKPHTGSNDTTLKDFLSEVNLLCRVRHPNVVMFLGASLHPTPSIVCEWVARGSLFEILHRPGMSLGLNWERRLGILQDAARGMWYLHSLSPSPIIHRDLKSHNLLIDQHWGCKIADFGISRYLDSNNTMTRVGTVHWSAPEMLRGERYAEKADVFSFGVIVFEVVTGKVPYDIMPAAKIIHKVAYEGYREPIPSNTPEILKDLITSCWLEDPAARPDFADICEMLSNVNPTDLAFSKTQNATIKDDEEEKAP